MSHDLLNKLEEKVQQAVDAMELLQVENEELKTEVQMLTEEKDQWESKLTALIDKFESIDHDSSETVEVSTEEDLEEVDTEGDTDSEYRQAIAS